MRRALRGGRWRRPVGLVVVFDISEMTRLPFAPRKLEYCSAFDCRGKDRRQTSRSALIRIRTTHNRIDRGVSVVSWEKDGADQPTMQDASNCHGAEGGPDDNRGFAGVIWHVCTAGG